MPELIGAALAVLADAPQALAARAAVNQNQTGPLILVTGVTALVSLLIGIVLYRYSQGSSKVKFKGATPEATQTRKDTAGPKVLLPVILDQLRQLPASAAQREQVARAVSDIVTHTIDEQVTTVKRELTHRYDQVVEEKRRNEAVLQKKYQDTLIERKQTSAVLESIAEGLVVINNRGEVVMMNPAAEKLLAVRQSDRIGHPLLENLKDEQLISLVQGTKDEDREIVLNAKQDQTKRVLRASNAVITDENGKTVGMVAVLSDVTRQREIEQLKSDFISTVSHELRTPIVAMRHALSILVDQVAGPLSEEQQSFAAIVQRNLDRLNVLINDLLDLSKLEAKKMELRFETGSVIPIIRSVCDSLEAWARTKAIAISKRCAEGLPDATYDPARLMQVLTNLLGNAIKFTPQQGRITVEAKLSDGAIEVSVTDTGLGIAKEDIPKLFNKFQQVGERTSSDIGGTGLGLVIAKEIVELHHGRIWVESDEKKGAKFAFTIPLKQSPV